MNEVSPWDNLEGCQLAGLRKIIRLLSAKSPSGAPGCEEELTPLFGDTGIKVAKELLLFISFKEEVVQKKDHQKKLKKSKTEAGDSSNENRWEVDFLTIFYNESIHCLGAANRDYGKDRHLIRLWRKRNDLKSTEAIGMIRPFFIMKDSTEFVERKVFGDGSLKSFINGWVTVKSFTLKVREQEERESQRQKRSLVPGVLLNG